MRFTLRQLSYFVTTGEMKSITAASERLHISQPSISSAISQMEEEFDVQLFFRHQGLSLTPAGEQILPAARELLQQARLLQDFVHDITSSVAGPLRVGVFRPFAPLLLPDLCGEFAKEHPKVTIETFEDDEAELVAKVRKAQLDIALTYEQNVIDLQFEPLASLPTYVLLPADHDLAGRSAIRLQDAAQLPFILLNLPVSKDYFLSLFRKLGVSPSIVAKSDQPETIRGYVAAGLGFSLMTTRPQSMTALNGKKLAYVPLDEDIPPMKLSMVTAKNVRKTRAIKAFEQHCRNNVSTMSIPGMTAWTGKLQSGAQKQPAAAKS